MKKISATLIMSLVLVGCQSTPSKEPISANENRSTQVEAQKGKRGFKYEPGSNEEFRFKSLPSEQQQAGYSQFCTDSRSYICDPLPYSKYHGVKGFFLAMEPAKTNFSGYEFRQIVLENGQRFFYVSNEKYGGIYAKNGPIVPISALSSLNNFIGKPIAANSEISVAGIEERAGKFYLKLSNGAQIRREQFTTFEKLISGVSDQKQLDELTKLLAGLELKHDISEDRMFILSKDDKSLPLRAYLVNKHGDTMLMVEHQYKADKWLFLRSFSLLADDVRYRSRMVHFNRYQEDGEMVERYIATPDPEYLTELNAASSSKKVVIRFYSDQFYKDQELSDEGKNSLKQILRVFTLLKN